MGAEEGGGMKGSKIEWTDHTFNPWSGCTKVSPGCENCYAEARDKRLAGGGWGDQYGEWNQRHWGPGAPRQRTTRVNWKKPRIWNRTAIHSCGQAEFLGSD